MATQGSGAELMELVNQMKGTIQEHFLPTLKGLQDKVDTESARVTDWLADINHSVQDATPALHDSFGAAEQRLSELMRESGDVMNATLKAVGEYGTVVLTVTGQVHDLVQAAVQHTTDVTEKLHASDETHGAVADQIAHALGDWTGHVTEHVSTIDGHHHTLVDAMHVFTDNANTHVTDLGSKLQQTGEAVTEHVATVVQTHTSTAAELLSQQKDHFVHAVGDALGGHVGDVIGHVQGFVQTGHELGGAFDGGLGDVLEKVDEVGKLIDSIKPVIDLAKKLS